MKRIGITGGIGTGKTSVTDLIGSYPGVFCIKTDDIAKQIGMQYADEVEAMVGFRVNFENTLSRKELAKALFENKELLQKYEDFIHPLVRNEVDEIIATLSSRVKICLIESALIFEKQQRGMYDDIIIITAEKAVRLERLIKRGLTVEESEKRMRNQIELPINDSRFITIDNSGDYQNLKEKVHALYHQLMGIENPARKKALYAGSFDPPTLGHEWLIKTAQKSFDVEVTIAENPDKKSLFTFDERKDMFEHAIPGIKVTSFVKEFTVDYAKKNNISVLIRGIRNTTDFAYEQMIYNINKQMDPELETFFLLPEKSLGEVSSSVVKSMLGIHSWEDRVKPFVNPYVLEKLKEKVNK